MKYAVVLNGTVMCVADWDGVTPWEIPFGGIAIPINKAQFCEAGWTYDIATGAFSATGE